MRMYDMINKKKRGHTLSTEEIRFIIEGFTNGSIPDYQMSALLMAIYFQGMTAAETADFTMAMVDSGDKVDLSGLQGVTVDKHSTGGVGDKTTLVVMPILAVFGLPVAKMSGRGLGHTGGTIDKLESIPGFNTDLPSEKFMQTVREHGICVAGQSANLAPADKKVYALRDVTATVDSIPLIAASIMSKKIAAGASCILLDVKTGSGAFMKDIEGARALAQAMVAIGENCGRKTAALITDMSAPLGYAIGNSLEIQEVAWLLAGGKNMPNDSEAAENNSTPPDLYAVCHALASHILYMAGQGTLAACEAKVDDAIQSGAALKKLADMVEAQGGDRSYIEHPEQFAKAACITKILAPQSGYISSMDTEKIGLAAMTLGAGRETPQDKIDYTAGIYLHAKTGDYVQEGAVIATFHTSSSEKSEAAANGFLSALAYSESAQAGRIMVYEKIGI